MVADDDRVSRLEDWGQRTAEAAGHPLELGAPCDAALRETLAQAMADRIMQALDGDDLGEALRLPPLAGSPAPEAAILSGGVSEYAAGAEKRDFGDLGPMLAQAVIDRLHARGLELLPHAGGIRATVVGASQYSVQVSGSTVFLDPVEALPLRNLSVIRPLADWSAEEPDPAEVAESVTAALIRNDLADGDKPVALALAWQGTASFARIDAFARGLVQGLQPILDRGHPLVFASDGDVGGLLGMHCREKDLTAAPVVSIDGVHLAEFDFVDIGAVLRATGAVPVVVKSLVFPSEPKGHAA